MRGRCRQGCGDQVERLIPSPMLDVANDLLDVINGVQRDLRLALQAGLRRSQPVLLEELQDQAYDTVGVNSAQMRCRVAQAQGVLARSDLHVHRPRLQSRTA